MILLKRGELLLPRVFCSVCKVKYILVKFTLNISTLPEKKRMFKVLSVNTQTAECICCISVICSFFSVQHLDGLNKTSISTILSNVLNVFCQNFSREFCALFSHKYWNFHICVNIFYIFSCILNSSLCVNSSCILNYSYCVRFSCIFYQTFSQ